MSYLKRKMSNVTPLYEPIAHTRNVGESIIISFFITVMTVIRNMKINMAWPIIGAFVMFHWYIWTR